MLAVAAVAAAGAAGAFVRETTTPGNPAGGTCLWWGQRQVTYQVNATSAASPPLRPACPDCTPCLDAGAAAALVSASLATWGAATHPLDALPCTDFTLQDGGATTALAIGRDGVNLVIFRSGFCGSNAVVPAGDACRGTVGACAAKYNCWEHDATGTIGLTTQTFDSRTGEILDADVEFHGRDWTVDSTGVLLTCATTPACSGAPFGPPPQADCVSIDVGSLALHEAGHVLGLDHTCRYAAPYDACPANSVMQPTMPAGALRRALTADDVSGVCTIYPRGAATATCPPTGPAPGGCGCGSGGGEGLLGIALVAVAGLRSRRRPPA